VAGLCIARIKLAYDAWDNSTCCGPIPILFTTDPTSTVAKLRAFPIAAFDLCQALYARLFELSVISSPVEALGYIKDPKDPKSKRSLVREWLEPNTRKSKVDNPAGGNQQQNASGRCPSCYNKKSICNSSLKPIFSFFSY